MPAEVQDSQRGQNEHSHVDILEHALFSRTGLLTLVALTLRINGECRVDEHHRGDEKTGKRMHPFG